MEIAEVISLCLVVLCAIGFGVMLYFKAKGNVFAAVSELIALAESTGLPGVEKMEKVVLTLHQMVPAAFRKLLTPEKLRLIAQGIFDWMRKYAVEYMAQQNKPKEDKEVTAQNNE